MSDILVIRIKFPDDYPIIYKSMKLRGELTVPEAVEYISSELSVPGGEQYGFYLPDQNFWLDNSTPLNEYRERLSNVQMVEFRDRTQASDGESSCCIIS
mmetsp:Transcript_1183/g.2834  ORF Transcript_1183/g.2834 Transcript_1183/m.2834 type:complete len:99 (+) Transcript_1183:166-462(+)